MEARDEDARIRRNLWLIWLIGAPLVVYALWAGVKAFNSASGYKRADSTATVERAIPGP